MSNNINWGKFEYDLDIAKLKEWENSRVIVELTLAEQFVEMVNTELYGNKIVGWASWVMKSYKYAQKMVSTLEEELKVRGLLERSDEEFIWED